MTTINGRPIDDMSKLEQWLVVVLTAKAPCFSEAAGETIDAIAITVNDHPCDLAHLAQAVQYRLEHAYHTGRTEGEQADRRILRHRLTQALERLVFEEPTQE